MGGIYPIPPPPSEIEVIYQMRPPYLRSPYYPRPFPHVYPDYYPYYGNQIANLCELLDKQEMTGLNENEKHNLTELKANIPQDIFNDYFDRREKNLFATKKFIDFTKESNWV